MGDMVFEVDLMRVAKERFNILVGQHMVVLNV